jgi:hypothetical protein
VKGAQKQPARMGDRVQLGGVFETVDFAKARQKRRRQRELAKGSKRKNRH